MRRCVQVTPQCGPDPRGCADPTANVCCVLCPGPQLDVLLDVMRSSPEVLHFVPHICSHAKELGLHLETLADHIGELGTRSVTTGDAMSGLVHVLTLRSHLCSAACTVVAGARGQAGSGAPGVRQRRFCGGGAGRSGMAWAPALSARPSACFACQFASYMH